MALDMGQFLKKISWNSLFKAQNLWCDLTIAVHQCNPFYLKKLEQFCLKEWAKILLPVCAKLIKPYPFLKLQQKVALQSIVFWG